jgi:endonuclease/exonuclease/phosphatase family metal-dependent hydrolase
LQLRILCYNIAHGRGVAVSNWDGGDLAERIARLDQIADLLRRVDADVVVLNEVDFDSSWSYSVNQARYLAEKSSCPHWVEQRNLDFRIVIWKWRFGNAILSKYPITNAQVADLPGCSTWETVLAGKKRGVICDIQAGNRVVRLIGTHLSHRRESLRVSSAAAILDIATGSALPTFVAGDLNSTPPGFPKSVNDPSGNNAIATFDNAERFRRSPTNESLADNDLTFHAAEPSCVIDWILIPHDWHFLRYRVEPSQLSDHRPVHADAAPDFSGTTSVAD